MDAVTAHSKEKGDCIMAEYTANAQQIVALNSPLIFNDSIPCTKGCVFHEDSTGIFILRGATPNCFARYQVTYNGNISIPTGGAITPIAVSIAVNGEERATSKAVFTPAAVETLGNVTSTAIITVPKGCCFTVSVRYVDATVADAATTPTPSIAVDNSNLVITRVA